MMCGCGAAYAAADRPAIDTLTSTLNSSADLHLSASRHLRRLRFREHQYFAVFDSFAVPLPIVAIDVSKTSCSTFSLSAIVAGLHDHTRFERRLC
jgi:hypothetical protein